MTATSRRAWSAAAADALRAERGFSLAALDTRSTPAYSGRKRDGRSDLDEGAEVLSDLQEKLFAQSMTGTTDASVLLVLQAMDTAGKGGIVRHVVGAVDPQGVDLTAFKKPTEEELQHDFLWRIEKALPGVGAIGVFDRSHYEDVLIGSVRELAPAAEIERRFDAINDFERRVQDSGTRIVKVMLHISKDEQRDRLAKRLDRPDKHWKYTPNDVDEREVWGRYMEAYQVVFDRTSTENAPWYVIPADRKWYARLAVQALLLDALHGIDPEWPEAGYDIEVERARLAAS